MHALCPIVLLLLNTHVLAVNRAVVQPQVFQHVPLDSVPVRTLQNVEAKIHLAGMYTDFAQTPAKLAECGGMWHNGDAGSAARRACINVAQQLQYSRQAEAFLQDGGLYGADTYFGQEHAELLPEWQDPDILRDAVQKAARLQVAIQKNASILNNINLPYLAIRPSLMRSSPFSPPSLPPEAPADDADDVIWGLVSSIYNARQTRISSSTSTFTEASSSRVTATTTRPVSACYSRNIAPLAYNDWTINLVKLIG